MRLDSLVSLINGHLVNTPSISQITTFTTEPAKVQRGTLFIALNPNDIPLAVQKGAYGVVFSGWAQMSDTEIAWIRVEELEKALISLIRFLLIQKGITLFSTSQIECELALAILHDNRVAYAFDDYEHILNAAQNPAIQIMLVEEAIAKKLSLDYQPLPSLKNFQIVQSYLFEMSLLCDGNFFERVPISPFFSIQIQKVLGLAFEYMLQFDLYHPTSFHHFKPLFVDHYFRLCEFGKSDRVLIVESDCTLFQAQATFLKQEAPWAKSIFLCEPSCNGFTQYSSLDELKNILYNSSFQLALIEGEIEDFSFLEKSPKINPLF